MELLPPERVLRRTGASAAAISVPWTIVAFLVIGATALVFRAASLGTFATTDELNFWMQRSSIFLRALQTGDFAATALTEHPGVTTMWLGALGIMLRNTLVDLGLVTTHTTLNRLLFMQLPVVLVHTLGVLAGYAMLRRMLAPLVAALAALLWASDPFIIAFSRVLHVDGPAMTFMTLGLLAACLYWHHERRPAWLVASAICGALALLSKLPALALLPTLAGVALLAAWREAGEGRGTLVRSVETLRRAAPPLLAWGLLCAAACFVLWPALWVHPDWALARLRNGVDEEGGLPHSHGNFFFGRYTEVPGVLFYPVALVMRLTPWALLGLLALPWALRPLAEPAPIDRRDAAALAFLAVFSLLALSLFPKQFNRYLVPIAPALCILAAAGLAWIARRAVARLRSAPQRQPAAQALLTGIAALSIANAAWYHPYQIVYFSQLFGGPQAGAQMFVVGWGEGLNLVADWLNQQPDITGVHTVAQLQPPLQVFMRRGAQAVQHDDGPIDATAGYVVVYVRYTQLPALAEPYDQYYGRIAPQHVVRIHGVEYAWVYQVPSAVGAPLAAQFGDALALRGTTLLAEPRPAQPLRLHLHWRTVAAPPPGAMLFAHLLSPDGRRYAQADLPLPADWESNRYYTSELALPLPADLPPGTYQLSLGVYDAASGARLPLHSDVPIDETVNGPGALPALTVEVR